MLVIGRELTDFFKGLALAWLPRVDGIFLTEPPQHAVVRGHVSNIPMITGKRLSLVADRKMALPFYRQL